MSTILSQYREVWCLDFEFVAPPGDRPDPVYLVAQELKSGRTVRLWQDDLRRMTSPPFPSEDHSVLCIAYYSSAEWSCYLALGWPLPVNVLDLYTEFRCLTNGLTVPAGNGLLGALRYYGLEAVESATKDTMRRLVLSGGPWSAEERAAILRYCGSDVDALGRLLYRMGGKIDLRRALLRGRYMKAVAKMERNGVPADTAALNTLQENWSNIQDRLIDDVAGETGIYKGRTFKMDRFEEFLERHNIPWPRLPTGKLSLTDGVFKDMSKTYPAQINPLRELRSTLSKMRLSDLSVGRDGRNRVLLSPFSSRTGRNQPSNSRFIFGPSTWLRSLIKPEPGQGLAYIDFSQQEFGIAAALSGDTAMKEAYTSGDCYLAFGRQSGLIPPDGTKHSHPTERGLCKSVILGTQYGMGSHSLALRISRPEVEARELLRLHRETYKTFWGWSDQVVNYALTVGELWTSYGWRCRFPGEPNPRAIRNYPMQANGAEMLRIACILLTEAGIRVCCPVHDAVLIEFTLPEAEQTIAETQRLMERASEIVLDGFTIRTDVDRIDSPGRYSDERGRDMWRTVWRIIGERAEAA